jgi:hypothetical protein
MNRLTTTLREQQTEAAKLDAAIATQPERAWVMPGIEFMGLETKHAS